MKKTEKYLNKKNILVITKKPLGEWTTVFESLKPLLKYINAQRQKWGEAENVEDKDEWNIGNVLVTEQIGLDDNFKKENRNSREQVITVVIFNWTKIGKINSDEVTGQSKVNTVVTNDKGKQQETWPSKLKFLNGTFQNQIEIRIRKRTLTIYILHLGVVFVCC